MNDMPKLAQAIVDELGLGHWEDDLIGREVGTAADVAEAIERIEEVRQDAVDALIALHKVESAATRRRSRRAASV